MTYNEKYAIAKEHMKKTLESKGLHVESGTSGDGLTVSFTQFGLSGVYADITANEIDYFINDLDDDTSRELGIEF